MGKVGAKIEIAINVLKGKWGALNEAAGKLGKLGGIASKVGTLMKGVAAGVGIIGVAVAGATVSMVNQAADFEERMKGVHAIIGANVEEMGNLNDEALRMGAETVYDAQEAAEALEMLSRQGITYQQIMDGAGMSTLNLAAATNADLATAAEVAASALNVFNMSQAELDDTVNMIAGAVNRSAMTVVDFRYAMQQGGSAVAEFGMSFEDMSTSIALFARNGIKGERAGTGLRMLLSKMVPQTKAAKAAFAEYGFTVGGQNQFFDASTGKMKEMDDIVALLQKNLGSLSDEERAAALQTMFGVRARQFANIMIREGTEGYKQMNEALHSTTAAEIAETRLDSFRGAMEKLGGEFETAKVTIGMGFLPVLKDLALWAEGVMEKAQPLWKFIGENIPVAVDLLRGKLTELIGINVGGDLAAKFKPFSDFMDRLRSSDMSGVSNQNIIQAEFDGGSAAADMQGFGAAIKESLTNLVGPEIIENLRTIWENLPTVVSAFADLAVFIAKAAVATATFLSWIGQAHQTWKMFVDLMNTPISTYIDAIWATIGPIIQGALVAAYAAIMSFIGSTIGSIQAWAAGVYQAYLDLKARVIAVVVEFLAGLVASFIENMMKMYQTITTYIDNAVEKFTTGWNLISTLVQTVLNIIGEYIRLKLDAALREMRSKIDHQVQTFQKGWDKIMDLLRDALIWVEEWIHEKLEAAKKTISDNMDRYTDIFNTAWNAIIDIVKTITTAIVNTIRVFLHGLKTDTETQWDLIKAIWGNAWTRIKEIVGNAKDDIVQTLKNIGAKIRETVSGWIDSIKPEAEAIGRALLEGIGKGVEKAWSWLEGVLEWFLSNLPQWIKDLLGIRSPAATMVPIGIAIMQGIAKGVSLGAADLKRTIKKEIGDTQKFINNMSSGSPMFRRGIIPDFSDVDLYRELRKQGVNLNASTRQGRGGFRAASGRNFWEVWSKWHGMNVPESQRLPGAGGSILGKEFDVATDTATKAIDKLAASVDKASDALVEMVGRFKKGSSIKSGGLVVGAHDPGFHDLPTPYPEDFVRKLDAFRKGGPLGRFKPGGAMGPGTGDLLHGFVRLILSDRSFIEDLWNLVRGNPTKPGPGMSRGGSLIAPAPIGPPFRRGGSIFPPIVAPGPVQPKPLTIQNKVIVAIQMNNQEIARQEVEQSAVAATLSDLWTPAY